MVNKFLRLAILSLSFRGTLGIQFSPILIHDANINLGVSKINPKLTDDQPIPRFDELLNVV